MAYKKLQGMRFGRLKVMAYHGKDKRGNATWFCECDCGEIKIAPSGSLVNGYTQSCGCYGKENPSNLKHGGKGTRLYQIWKSMNERCNTQTSCSYPDYGGRGIKVCSSWRNYISFRDWSLLNGYSDNLTIDRINNDGGYDPNNCRWATRKQQIRNCRRTVYATILGVTKPFAEWCEILGLDYKSTWQKVNRSKTRVSL